MSRTVVNVGVESHAAILNVERECVNVEITGAHNFDRQRIMNGPITVQANIRDRRRFVFLHAARKEEKMRARHLQLRQRWEVKF